MSEQPTPNITVVYQYPQAERENKLYTALAWFIGVPIGLLLAGSVACEVLAFMFK